MTAQAFGLMTGLVCLGAACLYVIIFTEVGLRFQKSPAHVNANVRTLPVTCGLLLFVMELFLRFGTDQYSIYEERADGRPYHSINRHIRQSRYHVRSPNKNIAQRNLEYSFPRRTNSLGILEKEIALNKMKGEYRIIALGDSFTEEWGCPMSKHGSWMWCKNENTNPLKTQSICNSTV